MRRDMNCFYVLNRANPNFISRVSMNGGGSVYYSGINLRIKQQPPPFSTLNNKKDERY